jgi:hypothetical protein
MSVVAQESSSRTGSHRTKQWWQGYPEPKQVVLYGFANVTEVAMLSGGPVKETCQQALDHSASRPRRDAKPLTVEQQAQVSDSVTEELAKGLERKIPVIYAQPPLLPSAGSHE